jgi:hypothetical protein
VNDSEFKRNAPPDIVRPLLASMPVAESPWSTVLVPEVRLRIFPALTVMPLLDEIPAEERAPVRVVEVPDVVLRNDPPVMVRPLLDASPAVPMPPVKVEDALARLILRTSPAIVPRTAKSVYGDVVPTPTRPEFVMRKAVEVA